MISAGRLIIGASCRIPVCQGDWGSQPSAGIEDGTISKTPTTGLRFDQENSKGTSVRPRRIPNYALGAHTASLGLTFYSKPLHSKS